VGIIIDVKGFLVAVILIVVLALGGFTALKLGIIPTSHQNNQVDLREPANASCTTGVDGNDGDNFCSNYRGSASKCTPGLPNTYPDGCSQTTP